MVAVIVIVSLAASALDRQAKLADTMVRQDMQSVLRLSANATRLQTVQADLERLLTLQALHAGDQEVTRQATALLASLDAVVADLRRYRAALTGDGQRRRLADLEAKLTAYRDALAEAGPLLDHDLAGAMTLIRPLQAASRITLASLVDDAVRDATAAADASVRIASTIRLPFAATATLLSVFITILAIVIIRATVRSVDAIAEATVLVARGDRSVNLKRLSRGDELGSIVKSLESLQDNVARVAFLAMHDALTGLPNRILFNDRLQNGLAQLDRGRPFAVLCLDLDRFKAVNDTLGHPIGDVLLRQVADRICACVREGDTVARLGGDEFAVVALDIATRSGAGLTADRIVHSLSQPFDLSGHSVCIGCSIGIAMAPEDGAFADRLLRKADTALYRAKLEGSNLHRFFEPGMDTQLQLRRELEADMRRAILAQEFELHYQPVITLKTMKVSGFEALMRWRHPQRGMIAPSDFIAVAEETGLIIALGELALMQACRDAMLWPDSIRVSVNLSPMQFKDTLLMQAVSHALVTSGLAPNRLELEITESVLLQQTDGTLATLSELHRLGVRLALDDFGTGYSSLSTLSSFHLDTIKIDQSFVRDLCGTENSIAIIRAVTSLSGSLGVATLAEGVETREQFDRLANEGVTEVQGYLFGRPAPARNVPLTLAEFGSQPASDQ